MIMGKKRKNSNERWMTKKMIKFRVVFKAFTDKLTEPQKVEFAELCKKFDQKGLSFILGGGVRKEMVNLSDIKLVGGAGANQGVIARPMFILTISIDMKSVLAHEELEQDYGNMLIYMREFLETYTVEIAET